MPPISLPACKKRSERNSLRDFNSSHRESVIYHEGEKLQCGYLPGQIMSLPWEGVND